MSGYVRTEYPAWSWSFSRQQLFASCQRRYYYNYYASHNGWEWNSEPEAALAYRLKKLTNLYIVLGDAVHKSAQLMVERLASGRSLPSAHWVEEEIRRQLRRVWKSSRDERDQFLLRPNRVDMLQEFYYRREISPNVIAKINDRIGDTARALVNSQVWAELQKKEVEIVSCEQFDTFTIGGTPVFAVPDLLYKVGDQWVIVDWKTGEEAEANFEQVALYALYVHKKHGVPVDLITARLEYLSLPAVEEMRFTAENLAQVENEAQESMARMRELLVDAEQNVPKPKEAFALTEAREQCPWCSFYELCQGELERSVS